MSRKVDVTITYLSQAARPVYAPQSHPPAKLAIIRAENPPVHFYRYLYDLVGGPWKWFSRKILDDATLAAVISNPEIYLYVLYVDGVPAGMAEIDALEHPVVHLRFFGLAPDFIGKGFSKYFLSNAIDLAWSRNPSEVKIETCTLDHRAALPLYQKFGFSVVDRRLASVDLPEMKEAPGL